jgi:uncharacterized protein (DUF983 family)
VGPQQQKPPRSRALGWGLAGACGRCGGRGLFSSYFTMRERCPTCGYRFEREEGYWLGAMVVAIGVTEAVFGIFLVGALLLTWPDVPWTALLIGGLALNATLPFLLYPWTKTVWVGLHLAFVPPEPAEEADAATARAAGEPPPGER